MTIGDAVVALPVGNAHTIRSNDQRNQVNAILRSFKRLKANAADGGKPYKEDTVEFKDSIDGLNIVVRLLRLVGCK